MKPITVFTNEMHELRAGWQLLIFLLVFGGVFFGLSSAPGAVLESPGVALGVALSLISVLIASYIAVRVLHNKPLAAIGLTMDKRAIRDLGIGTLAGLLMMTFVFGCEYAQGYVKVVAPEISLLEGAKIFLYAMLFFAGAALFEEILFRGYPFQTLVRGIGFLPATILIALAFGAAHLANPNASAFGFLNTALVSVLFCLAYWRTRNLALPFGIHFGWNFAQTTLYGFPTSGHHFTQFELTQLTQFGPEWITGGAYGPEAGVLATLAITGCTAYVLLAGHLRPAASAQRLEREGEVIQFPFPELRRVA